MAEFYFSQIFLASFKNFYLSSSFYLKGRDREAAPAAGSLPKHPQQPRLGQAAVEFNKGISRGWQLRHLKVINPLLPCVQAGVRAQEV